MNKDLYILLSAPCAPPPKSGSAPHPQESGAHFIASAPGAKSPSDAAGARCITQQSERRKERPTRPYTHHAAAAAAAAAAAIAGSLNK